MSADWTIDTIIHALPSPDMRQQALREIHLAPVDQLATVVEKWRTIAVCWVHQEARRIQTALTAAESTGKLPAEYEETAESAGGMDAWRNRMEQLRHNQQAGAA